MQESLEVVYKRFPRLEERKGQRAGTLSGGEQQMLAMGRAHPTEKTDKKHEQTDKDHALPWDVPL